MKSFIPTPDQSVFDFWYAPTRLIWENFDEFLENQEDVYNEEEK